MFAGAVARSDRAVAGAATGSAGRLRDRQRVSQKVVANVVTPSAMRINPRASARRWLCVGSVALVMTAERESRILIV